MHDRMPVVEYAPVEDNLHGFCNKVHLWYTTMAA